MAYDIFLSYRRSDSELARGLVNAFETEGLQVWWDQKIEGGEDWRDAIVEGLSDSHALVILFSEECNASKQLKKELAIADTLDKEIIPVLIEDTKPKGHYLYELAARNWLQIFPNPETKLSQVAKRLAGELDHLQGRTRAAPAAPPAASATGEAPLSAPVPGTQESMTISPPAAPDPGPTLEADTVEKVVAATQAKETAKKRRRDFLPFKWYEVLIAAIFAGLAALGSFDVETGEVITGSVPLDIIGTFLMTLMIIAMVVFPFRYYFRRRRVWHAVRFYALSVFVLAIALGIVFGIHPDIADETIGIGENLLYALLGSIIVFGAFAVVTFGIYGLLHFQRTMRSFNRNVEAI